MSNGKSRTAAAGAWIGSALEYYDFFIYGSAAALIFPKVFFNPDDPSTATLTSLATFGVAYAARPVGALILGHFGDRLGRRRIMVFTVALMGLATFLIGCLPTYRQIGAAAPVLLVVLRVLQGLSAAGEQAGASSLTLEHSPEGRRGFFTSFTLIGTQFGQIIATLVFIPVADLPERQLLSWGWRIPFLVSAVVTVVAYLIRRRLDETPEFRQAAQEGRLARLPLAELLRRHWTAVLRIVLASTIATASTVFTVWALSFGAEKEGLDRSLLLWVGVAANVVAVCAIPLWARLSDRIGRKPVFAVGCFGSAALFYPYVWSLTTRSYPLVFLFGVLFFGVVYSAANGVWPSFYAEMFSTQVRLSGLAVGTQIGFAVAGFAVTFAQQIQDAHGWLGVAGFSAVICVIAGLAGLTARETHRIPTAALGQGIRTEAAARPLTTT
ncbi:MFS transporter [Phaeacidiphilus oryzae]|uniref:MFS transporter n=1 Tax=Phaeacidiphilus oryzae TaxID=348818 RepID=UPI00056C8F87|nr:MFS transporter [Phaeacidiphilus oryzae]